ncbi:hypothetical protein K450DRAFT_244400 [Umbelopsis ramanniana AG]|uniref:Uncharacterized protein n=1 Tax=Umbelopsis ramanniana AG TaxID=1314678 RepID=A0AAD5E7X9_UMBRA|nr:uncharacterized protein K450DRAFT_244400 [Umbelopsis ramanniana AG]KAI8578976.1 hypothetical protein K450DRAFT_244400 [Umbelopsis ramanniana AG]
MLRVLQSSGISRRAPAIINNIGARAFSSTPSNNEEVEIFVDGKSVKVEQGAALIQACEKAGADVSWNSPL